MTDQARNFEFFCRLGDAKLAESLSDIHIPYLNIQGGVEAHLQVALIVLVEQAKERLLENGGGEGVGEHDNAVGGVG